MQVDELPPCAVTARPGHGAIWEAARPPIDQGEADGQRKRGPRGPRGAMSLPEQGRNRLSALLVVVFLALPVSELSGLLNLQLGAVSLELQALEYWVMVALVAASCVCSGAD